MRLIGIVYPQEGGYLLFKNRYLEYRPSLPDPKTVGNFMHHRPGPDIYTLGVSAFCRQQRAVELIESATEWNVDFLKSLLSDSSHGETGFCISRHRNKGDYQTVGSLMVDVRDDAQVCHYVVNRPPKPEFFRAISLLSSREARRCI